MHAYLRFRRGIASLGDLELTRIYSGQAEPAVTGPYSIAKNVGQGQMDVLFQDHFHCGQDGTDTCRCENADTMRGVGAPSLGFKWLLSEILGNQNTYWMVIMTDFDHISYVAFRWHNDSLPYTGAF
jgi:hypothetical protein